MTAGAPPGFASLRINRAPGVYRCEPQWNWAPPPLPDHDLWFVLSGHGTMEVSGRRHDVSAGKCFLLRPGETPRGTQDPQNRLTVFFAHFDVLDAEGALAEPLEIPGPVILSDSAFSVATAHHIDRLWQRGGAFARQQAHLALSILLWQVWDESHSPFTASEQTFEAVTAAIRREPGRRWTLDEMASEVHLSRAQLTRRFRALFGTSPTRFVIETRLERARQLLAETDMTLEQIAQALGYTDAFFFSRQFKQFTGHSPGAHRRHPR